MVYDRDVSKQKEAEVMREDMARIAQHDLKSPLNGIINLPVLLKMSDNLTEKQIKRLDLIESAGYKMLNMINNSLDLYKMEQGTYTFLPAAINLLTIVNKISEEYWSVMQSNLKQIEIVNPGKSDGTDLSDASYFTVLGDELLCYSMLANLVKNAVESSPRSSVITITLDDSQGAEIRIHNSGRVPLEIEDIFFDKYSTAGKQGGTGLGTYSARLMARTQNGEITMTSSDQEGTTLFIKLPTPDNDTPVPTSSLSAGGQEINNVAEANEQPDPVISNNQKKADKFYQILMAEDDPINQALASALLQERNAIEVTTVSNGKEALDAMESKQFDLVLMDMQMPEMDGMEATRRIRQIEEGSGTRTPVVAMTGMSGTKNSNDFFKAGIDAFIAKPIQIDLMWETIDKFLEIDA